MRRLLLPLLAAICGCTAESTRVAIESQQRANDVQEAVFDRQHQGLAQLLYDDTIRRMELAPDGAALSVAQRAVLNEAWNERDLLEFWRVQFERSKALRLMGVDAKLFSDQAVVDLLIKALDAKWQRGKEAVATAAGEQLSPGSEPTPESNGRNAQAPAIVATSRPADSNE